MKEYCNTCNEQTDTNEFGSCADCHLANEAETVHKMLWYLFNKVPMPEADLHSDVEDGSEQCERLNDLFWKVIKHIEKINTEEQITVYIKGLQS